MVSLILSAPVILYQVWAFIAQRCISMNVAWWCRCWFPALAVLYRHGVRLLCGLSAGIWLLANTAPEGVQVSTDIASYLTSLWRCLWRLVSPLKCRWQLAAVLDGDYLARRLTQKTPVWLVGAFVVGMLLTPPDVFSQSCWRSRCTVCLKSVSSSHAFRW